MGKEKKSSAELVEDRPQKQGKKPGKARSKPQEAPMVEGKLTGAARASTGKSAPTGEARRGSGAGKLRGSGGGNLQVSGEEKDREIKGPREGAKSLQRGGNIQGGGEGGRRAFEHLDDGKKRRVLQHYINTGGQVGKSCRLAGISHQTHYNWLANDPDYKAAYALAQERSLDVIEQEIIRRGVKGYKEPIIYQGRITGHVRRYSDNLLMFLAKRRDPLYRDNPQLALGLKAAGDVKIAIQIPRPDQGETVDAEAREVTEK